MSREKHKTPPPDFGGPAKPPPYLHEYLSKLAYPTRTKLILLEAHKHNFPPDIMRVLARLPDREFYRPEDVFIAAEAAYERTY